MRVLHICNIHVDDQCAGGCLNGSSHHKHDAKSSTPLPSWRGSLVNLSHQYLLRQSHARASIPFPHQNRLWLTEQGDIYGFDPCYISAIRCIGVLSFALIRNVYTTTRPYSLNIDR